MTIDNQKIIREQSKERKAYNLKAKLKTKPEHQALNSSVLQTRVKNVLKKENIRHNVEDEVL